MLHRAVASEWMVPRAAGQLPVRRAVFESKTTVLIVLLDEMILARGHTAMLANMYFDTRQEFEYAFCWCLAVELCQSYFINAFAKRASSQTLRSPDPTPAFRREVEELCASICRENFISRTILDSVGTLDISVELELRGPHLILEITTFPFTRI